MKYCKRCGGTKKAQDGSCSEVLYRDMKYSGIPVYCMQPADSEEKENDK